MSLTAFRQELFKVVDQVIATGLPVEINRKGHIVRIVLAEKKSKLKNLREHDCINGDPDDLIQCSISQWEGEPEL